MKDFDEIRSLEGLRQYAMNCLEYLYLQLKDDNLEPDLYETRLEVCAQNLSNLGQKMKEKLRENLY